MSAPPTEMPNGQNPSGQPPRPPPIKRRPRGDPLVARKRPGAPRPAAARPGPNALQTAPGARASPGASGRLGLGMQRPMTEADIKARRAANGGWLDPPPPGVKEWKIVKTKKSLIDGIRHHIMKLSSSKADLEQKGIDPTNQEEFTRPVTLQRRDPRQPPPGREIKQEQPEAQPVDEKEAERLAQLKADREAVRAVELAKSAPSLKDPAAAQKPKPKKKEEDVQFHRAPRSEKEKKQQELRYEEALPWHLEDADGKNVWVGSYVAPLSETTICFVATRGKFVAVPMEKWYKFTAKPHFNTMRLEEAEALMSKKTDIGRWYMRDKQKKSEQDEWEATRHALYGPARIKTESNTFRAASREEKMDHDQIDMEGDEFQDDDEAPGLEVDNDEDFKEATERIRRDQLGANLFGDADERRVEKELNEEKKAEEERRKEGKRTTKALIKREKETIYQSDSSGYDPFESSSSEEDSDEEKKDEENKDKEKEDGDAQKGDLKDKNASAVSSKGNTTPSGRPKHTDALKKGKSLKRPGSPTLSESSGNESSRKKMKKNPMSSFQQSRSSTPSSQGPAGQKSNLGKGAFSDGEATAGEMSDGQPRKKKIKLLGSGARGTPVGSRAGSPAPAAPGSKPGSPLPEGSPAPRAGSPSGLVEAWEIIAALPELPNGISIGNLMRKFQSRIGEGPGKMERKDWIKLVRENCAYGPDKVLRRKS
ncbi:Transcription initiation factor IIF subunit alpha [Colletotrichum spinosum]|uniref:Transcription initiation factor IIF subunit alpha n=1 Tax=Colletotrichum spinosum TaxID=1347390 RepID=A0A4R8QNG2_9PEZI|nr:Transcription initiation factor IIF subunit alpha [Colletotrichum spinosum]